MTDKKYTAKMQDDAAKMQDDAAKMQDDTAKMQDDAARALQGEEGGIYAFP